jgi:hypothetical protein
VGDDSPRSANSSGSEVDTLDRFNEEVLGGAMVAVPLASAVVEDVRLFERHDDGFEVSQSCAVIAATSKAAGRSSQVQGRAWRT